MSIKCRREEEFPGEENFDVVFNTLTNQDITDQIIKGIHHFFVLTFTVTFMLM
jgi:hypothetical protein